MSTEHPNKGKLFVQLKPRQCSNCPSTITLDQKALYMDTRVYTESGWLPYIEPGDAQHFYYVFCGLRCMQEFIERTIRKGEASGLL